MAPTPTEAPTSTKVEVEKAEQIAPAEKRTDETKVPAHPDVATPSSMPSSQPSSSRRFPLNCVVVGIFEGPCEGSQFLTFAAVPQYAVNARGGGYNGGDSLIRSSSSPRTLVALCRDFVPVY